jgi:hypothetical protein
VLACDGLGFDFTEVKSRLVEDKVLHVGVVHYQKLHQFAQHCALQLLALTCLLHPFEVSLNGLYHS